MHVVIVQEVVLQYRVPFYEGLRSVLAAEGIALTVVHSNPEPPEDLRGDAVDLPWARRVRSRWLRVGGSELVWQSCREALSGSDLVVVEQGSRHLLNYLLAVEQVLGRRHLALWGHGRNLHPERRSKTGEWIKAKFIRVAHWWFAYTEQTSQLVAAAGFPPERITVVQNAVDTRGLARLVDDVTTAELDQLYATLGATPGRVVMFIGGLSSNKRLEFLFEALEHVRAAVSDVHLVVVGDGPEAPIVEAWTATRPWAHRVGARFGREKAVWLKAARVVAVPAWAGLVVLDAFAGGVPVVVSAGNPHPPELSYVEHGVNGLVVDDAGDPRVYAAGVIAALTDDQLHQRLVTGCGLASERYSIEEMVNRFADGVRKALAAS